MAGRLLQRVTSANPSTTWNTLEYGILSRGGGWEAPLTIPCLKNETQVKKKKVCIPVKQLVKSKANHKNDCYRSASAQEI